VRAATRRKKPAPAPEQRRRRPVPLKKTPLNKKKEKTVQPAPKKRGGNKRRVGGPSTRRGVTPFSQTKKRPRGRPNRDQRRGRGGGEFCFRKEGETIPANQLCSIRPPVPEKAEGKANSWGKVRPVPGSCGEGETVGRACGGEGGGENLHSHGRKGEGTLICWGGKENDPRPSLKEKKTAPAKKNDISLVVLKEWNRCVAKKGKRKGLLHQAPGASDTTRKQRPSALNPEGKGTPSNLGKKTGGLACSSKKVGGTRQLIRGRGGGNGLRNGQGEVGAGRSHARSRRSREDLSKKGIKQKGPRPDGARSGGGPRNATRETPVKKKRTGGISLLGPSPRGPSRKKRLRSRVRRIGRGKMGRGGRRAPRLQKKSVDR